MDFIKFIETIPNITIAKRVASAYVADYRRLELDELKVFLKKTAKQYTSFENISNRLEEIKLPEKCTDCKYEGFCKKCPGILCAECGSCENVTDAFCEEVKALYEIYHTKEETFE